MSYFADNLRHTFDSKGLSSFRAALDLGIDPAVMSKVVNGNRKPPKKFIEAVADYDELGLSIDEMYSWKILDEYSKEQILLAAKICKNTSKDVQ